MSRHLRLFGRAYHSICMNGNAWALARYIHSALDHSLLKNFRQICHFLRPLLDSSWINRKPSYWRTVGLPFLRLVTVTVGVGLMMMAPCLPGIIPTPPDNSDYYPIRKVTPTFFGCLLQVAAVPCVLNVYVD